MTGYPVQLYAGQHFCLKKNILYTLFDENVENHASSLALLLIYIDFDK
jgi:hypothetical protein